MDEQTRKLVEEIVHEALDAPPGERDGIVSRKCGDDAALEQEVRSLLRFAEEDERFLEVDAKARAVGSESETIDEDRSAGTTGEFKAGDVVGPYKILEVLGVGGFGVVYHASQSEPVRRRVALKVLKKGMDSDEVLRRFDAEREALARMDHPNIARVVDAGETPLGTPYFAMELVRGVPITDYCRDRALGVRDRLGLFVRVCNAVQHAHQKGVIHRDLKPSNILVTDYDGNAVPKVIDFGIAKAIEGDLSGHSIYTRFGQIIGTLEYMSPEQIEMSAADIDTRSDIYSLGVVLYEVLTGLLPYDKERFRKAAWDEIRRIIREEAPPKPSTRLSSMSDAETRLFSTRGDARSASRRVRGDVDWIVLKAMEKDRTRRYESASSFADDIVRYLNNDPVEAGPPSATYRIRKFIGRHKGVVTAAMLFVLALVVGLIGTTSQWARAEGALEREREARVLAQERYEFIREFAGEFMRELDDEIRTLEGSSRARRVLADTSIRVLERLESEAGQSDELTLDIALSYQQIGQLEDDLEERLSVVIERLRKAEARLVPLADQGDEQLRALLNVRTDLAFLLPEVQDLGSGLALIESVEPEARGLADRSPTVENEALLARALAAHGTLLRQNRSFDDAKPLLDEALAIRERLANARPDDPNRQEQVALSHESLGTWHWEHAFAMTEAPREERIEEAERSFEARREALRIWERLASDDPDVPRYSNNIELVRDGLARNLMRMRRYDEARAMLHASREMAERAYELEPENRLAYRNLALKYEAISDLEYKLARYDAAEDANIIFLERAKVALRDDPTDLERIYRVALATELLADCRRKLDELALARGGDNSAASTYRELSDLDLTRPLYAARFALALTKSSLMSDYLDDDGTAAGQYRRALSAFNELESRLLDDGEMSDAEQTHRTMAYRNLAYIVLDQGDAEEAVDLLERAVETMPESERRRPKVLWYLGKAHAAAGRNDRAREYISEAIRMMEEEPDEHTVLEGELDAARQDLANLAP